jgi:hypothetical protein
MRMLSSVAIEKDLPTLVEVDGHHRPVPFLLTADMFGGLPVELAGAEISGLVGQPVAAPHVHEIPEIYLLFSPEPGGATITVEIEDESFDVDSPAAVYIPAGKKHRFVTRAATRGSYCYGMFIRGEAGSEVTR